MGKTYLGLGSVGVVEVLRKNAQEEGLLLGWSEGGWGWWLSGSERDALTKNNK